MQVEPYGECGAAESSGLFSLWDDQCHADTALVRVGARDQWEATLRGQRDLKLADYFNLQGVFGLGSMPDSPTGSNSGSLGVGVVAADFHAFLEVVFQNNEPVVNSWHIDGYSFFVVG